MAERSKVWVIDDGKAPELTNLGDPLRTASRPILAPTPRHGARGAARPAAAPRAATAARPRARRPVQSATLVVLTYLLGPAALLLVRRGRGGAARSALAAGWAVTAAALGLVWWSRAGADGAGQLVPWLAGGTVIAVVFAFTLWARALHLTITSEAVASHSWSPRLANPWSAAVLGLLAPGSAQVLAHRPGRAVAVLWAAWPFVAAVLAVLQAPLMWSHREAFATWGLDALTLERLLLVAAVAAAVAPLLWLGQALEGARVVAARAGRWRNARGDWSAVALAAALVAAVVVVDPGTIAAGLGEYADGLAAEGCTVTPLLLVRGARQLDPAQPAYALQAADLYAAAGAAEQARQVRADLDRTLQPYMGALLRDGQRDRSGTAARRRGGTGSKPSDARGEGAMPAVAGAAAIMLPTALPVAEPAGPPAPAPAADSLP